MTDPSMSLVEAELGGMVTRALMAMRLKAKKKPSNHHPARPATGWQLQAPSLEETKPTVLIKSAIDFMAGWRASFPERVCQPSVRPEAGNRLCAVVAQ